MTPEDDLLTLFRQAEPSLRRLLEEDDVQQTWLKCVEYTRAKGAPPPSVAYIVQMGMNARADEARKCRPVGLLGAEIEGKPSEEPSPAERLEKLERSALLRSALDSLSERDRRVLQLYYLEGQSYEMIAQTLDLSPKAARTVCCRAKKALKRKCRNIS